MKEQITKKQIKEFILLALDKKNKPEMPIEMFIQMIGEEYRKDIDDMIDSLKWIGIIYEPKSGWLKLL